MALELFSSAFRQGQDIPKEYTCDGKNISPPLVWKDVPAGTKSLVLIMQDPDAPSGAWDHWMLYNIPATAVSLPEGLRASADNIPYGKNSWGNLEYDGPCPPRGEHRYFFKLYAIDTTLLANPNMNKSILLAAVEGHILASAELMAKYQRSN